MDPVQVSIRLGLIFNSVGQASGNLVTIPGLGILGEGICIHQPLLVYIRSPKIPGPETVTKLPETWSTKLIIKPI
jgi:hypothetical protein